MKKENLYLLVGISCPDCGQVKAILYNHKSTEDERQNLKNVMGGMHCIKIYEHKININEIVILEE